MYEIFNINYTLQFYFEVRKYDLFSNNLPTVVHFTSFICMIPHNLPYKLLCHTILHMSKQYSKAQSIIIHMDKSMVL